MNILYKGRLYKDTDKDLPEEVRKKLGLKKPRPARNPKPKVKEEK